MSDKKAKKAAYQRKRYARLRVTAAMNVGLPEGLLYRRRMAAYYGGRALKQILLGNENNAEHLATAAAHHVRTPYRERYADAARRSARGHVYLASRRIPEFGAHPCKCGLS